MTKPRILYTTYGAMLRQSGFSQQCRSELRELSRRGYGVTLLAFENHRGLRSQKQGRHSLEAFCREHGIELRVAATFAEFRPMWRPLRGRLDRRTLAAEARRCRAAVLHAHNAYLSWVAADVGRRLEISCVADLHGVALPEYLYAGGREEDPEYRWRALCEQRAVQGCDAVFVVSGPFRDYVLQSHGVDAGKVAITPSSVDVATFDFNPSARAEFRERLGAGERPVLLFIGSIQKYHVFHEVVAFVKAVREVRADALFLVLTTDQEATRAELASLGLTDGVHVHSVPHDEVPGWISASDVGLLLREPSMVNRAASPVKLAEYLACGLPVVISDGIGDLSEAVRERQLGVMIEELSQDAYRRAAQALFAAWPDPQQQARRERCRRFAVEGLSWEYCMSVFEETYRRIAPDRFPRS